MIGAFGPGRFEFIFNGAQGRDYAQLIHAFLISSDVKDGRRVLAPGIASKWAVSADGKTWTMTIRKGAKFHDGSDLTVADVFWTMQHGIGPQAKNWVTGAGAELSNIMEKLEQSGPDQVSLTTKQPTADIPSTLSEASANWSGTIIPKRTTLHDDKEELAYDQNPIGAGPMKLVKHVKAQSMTFERFADYYEQPKNGFPSDKRVNFTTLDLLLVPEEATRVAALRAGDADVAPVSLGARKQVESGGGRLVFGQEGAVFDVRFLGCWEQKYPCSDKRVRQALSYAVNKEPIRLLYGADVMQTKGWTLVTPSGIGYSADLDPYPFDPGKARQLLADAGYPGGKGFGTLVIDTWVSSSLPLLTESAQVAAESWKKELGLDVQVKVGDSAAVKKSVSTTTDLFGHVLWRDNDTRMDGGGGLRSQYNAPDTKLDRAHGDRELYSVVEKALAVLDPAEKEKSYNSTYRRLRDDAYYVNIGYINIPWALSTRVRAWQPYPLANYISGLYTMTLK